MSGEPDPNRRMPKLGAQPDFYILIQDSIEKGDNLPLQDTAQDYE
jgi:hypothetical protein